MVLQTTPLTTWVRPQNVSMRREGMDPLTAKVAARWAFKYQPKEKKKSKIDRLGKYIRAQTGIGRGQAEDIADAIIRGRELDRLAVQKNWPVEDGKIKGDKGSVSFKQVRDQL